MGSHRVRHNRVTDTWGSQVVQGLKKKIYLPMQGPHETQSLSLGWEDPLEEEMVTHSCSCLENPRGQRSLAGSSPWSRTGSDTTE